MLSMRLKALVVCSSRAENIKRMLNMRLMWFSPKKHINLYVRVKTKFYLQFLRRSLR
jgi:hypothetical protein